MVKKNDAYIPNSYRKTNRGSYSRGSPARGRNNYFSRRGYLRHNKYFHNRHWNRVPARQGSRPASPIEGSQEFMDRKIQQTSAIIMRQLLSPNEPIVSLPKLSARDLEINKDIGETSNECVNTKENQGKQNEKGPNKTRKISASEISVKEIHEKIMNQITNLNDGRKKNFINAHDNTTLDTAIEHIHKQKRLELSRVLRDMCSSSYNLQESGELINSIIPDIGIKIEELPIEVIQELRQTLNIDLDEGLLDTAGLTNDIPIIISDDFNAPIDSTEDKILTIDGHVTEAPDVLNTDIHSNEVRSLSSNAHITISSEELNAAIDSIQMKTEQIDPECTGSIEIKLEDIAGYDDLDNNIERNAEETQLTSVNATLNQETLSCENELINPIESSVTIKQEHDEIEIDIQSVASTYSQSTVLFSNINSDCEETEIIDRNERASEVFGESGIPEKEKIDSGNNLNTGKTNIEGHIDHNTDNRENIEDHIHQNTNNHTNPEQHEACSRSDDSLSSLEQCVSQFIDNEDVRDLCDLSKVSTKLDVINKCLKYLSEYKEFVIKSFLDHCLNKNREGISISQNVTEARNVERFSNQASQTDRRKSSETSEDEDEIVTKKRKVENSTEKNKIGDLQIKTEEVENKQLEDIDVLMFPKLQDKVLVIERVDNQLVLATDSGKIIYASLKDSTFLHTVDVTNSPITSLVFLRGINEFIYMYVGSLDPVLRIYDFTSRKMIKATTLDDCIRCMDAMWDYVFMGCSGGTLIRYSTKKAKIEFEERNRDVDILVIKAAQEGPRRILLIGHKQAPIYVRDAMSGLCLRNFSNEAITPTVYALIVNNNNLYCGTAHNNILVFSFHEGNLLHRLFAENCKGISCMKIYNNLLFSGCYNGSIYVYHLKMKKLLTTLKGPGGGILCMEVINNQVIAGTLTGQFGSVAIPGEVNLGS